MFDFCAGQRSAISFLANDIYHIHATILGLRILGYNPALIQRCLATSEPDSFIEAAGWFIVDACQQPETGESKILSEIDTLGKQGLADAATPVLRDDVQFIEIEET
jgi:hypothetical protein